MDIKIDKNVSANDYWLMSKELHTLKQTKIEYKKLEDKYFKQKKLWETKIDSLNKTIAILALMNGLSISTLVGLILLARHWT